MIAQIADLAGKLPGASSVDKTSLRHSINAVKYYDNMLDLLWNA